MDEGYHWVDGNAPSDTTMKNYRHVTHVASFGSYGRKLGQFLDPLGISSGDDYIYLTDPMQNSVNVFSHTYTFIEQISGAKQNVDTSQFCATKERRFSSVFDVTVHKPTNTILVTDPVKKYVHAMNKNVNSKNTMFDKVIPILKADSLAGICVTKEGILAVTDSESGRVIVCDGKGEIKTVIGKEGDQPGEFCVPQFLCWDEFNERLLVSDTANARVQAFTLDGEFLFTFGSEREKDGCFEYPSGIDVDEHGRIFVVDQGLHNVQIFDKNGDWLHTIGGPGIENGFFHSPKGLSILPNGDMFVTDSLNCRVQHFS